MAKYEVWTKANLGARSAKPESTHFTPDVAMDEAKRLSKGYTTENWHDWIKNTSTPIQVPKSVAVIVRDTDTTTLGWGIGGKWYTVKADCKRCSNSGMDPTTWVDLCASCKGSSYKPKV
jgi:hypothetical protein